MKINILTIKEVEYCANHLAAKLMKWDEPIPDFHTRFPNILESCLAIPFGSFGGKDLYRSLDTKAAILFYLMIKNHPFQNGNKRIAVMALLLFLYKNKLWLFVDENAFYHFAVWVAASPAELKDETVFAIRSFIRKHKDSRFSKRKKALKK